MTCRIPLSLLTLLILMATVEAATLRGTVKSKDDGVLLPGVELTIEDADSGELAAKVLSDEAGAFEVRDLAPGNYRLTAQLAGFEPEIYGRISLQRGAVLSLDIELSIAGVQETVEVVGKQESKPETATSVGRVAGERINVAPVKGDDFSALLPLLPGVVRAADGRINMKGGGATQSSLVVNNSTNVTDPATGNSGFNLPSDAIQEVEVLPNPYAAEFGRFSSGITNILTRQGTPKWKFSFNNFLPRPKIRDGSILGIGGFTPRFSARGPIVQDRLFLAQTFQYRFLKTRVDGQPDLRNDKRLESFDSFSQIDLFLGDRHSLTALISFFPRRLDFVTLDTFNPLEVTANLHQRGYGLGLSERTVFSPSAILESTFSFKRYDVDIFGQGLGEMFLTPEGNQGNFFNLQRRRTRSWQLVENFTFLREAKGEHVLKFGIDILRSSFDGLSLGRPVNILRADGTLSQRIQFSGPSSQRLRTTDYALYGQDRWRFNDRMILEFGVRLDRDGVLERTHFSPRVGLVLGLLPNSRSFLRGGAGYFYDRTPLNVGAFTSYERRTVTRFAADGLTEIGSTSFQHRVPSRLDTPYSFIWNVEYDQWLGEKLLLKANYLRRNGFREHIVDLTSRPEPALALNSRGRSRYWEVELTGRYIIDQDSFLLLSYVRSRSRKDLNAFDDYFGNFRRPVIRENEFAPADTDTPHRLLFQGTVIAPGNWIISPVVEVRSGFPYSTINQDQDFVGPRNQAGRFPSLATLDLDVQRWIKIWKWNTRVGIRIFNLFNTFNPRNVQGNIDSSQFGVFSNGIDRFFGATFQIEN